MAEYYTEEQVRKHIFIGQRQGLVQTPWQSLNSNWAQAQAELEFWEIALGLDRGKFLDGRMLTYARRHEATAREYAQMRIEACRAYLRGGSVAPDRPTD
jgi:hypothetical protein